MASALYNSGRDAFLNKAIDWVNDTIKAVLVNTDNVGGHKYTVDLAAHANLSDVKDSGAATTCRVLAPAALSGKSTGGAGIANASAPLVMPGITSLSGGALILYKDTGVEATSTLIAYIDTASAGLPVAANTNGVNVTWDVGANKIFKL